VEENRRSAPTSRAIEAAKRLLAIHNARDTFEGFVRYMRPNWTLGWFQIAFINALDLFIQDKLPVGYNMDSPREAGPNELVADSLLITMPPRHSKSSISSILLPPYMLGHDPEHYIMSCSYNSLLSNDFSREVRAILLDPEYRKVFPSTRLAKNARALDAWQTSKMGKYFGIGLGGSTSGRPANLLNLDDPIKNRVEAESVTIRKNVWDYYLSALNTRLQPPNNVTRNGSRPKQVVTLTRWHPEDIGGMLQQLPEWKTSWVHLNFAALLPVEVEASNSTSRRIISYVPPTYDSKQEPALGKDGNYYISLWPERFPPDALLRKQEMNRREFDALYQQTPTVAGGNLLKSSWWRWYDDRELNDVNIQHFQAFLDPAVKTGQFNDYSVAGLFGLSSVGNYYLIDLYRKRVDLPDLKRDLSVLHAQHRANGLSAWNVEDAGPGGPIIAALRKETALPVVPYRRPTRDKVTRTNAITPIIEAGRVYLPRSRPWIHDFIKECEQFPSGTHDDQVDVLTMAIDRLSRLHIDNPLADMMTTSLNSQLSLSGSDLNLQIQKDSLSRQVGGNNALVWAGWGESGKPRHTNKWFNTQPRRK